MYTCIYIWDDLAVLLAGVFPGVTWRPWGRTRAGRIPASYPISINKKVDEPRRGCTYGPEGLCRSHEDFRITFLI